MTLTWKDAITTILAVIVASMYYARIYLGIDLPVIGSSYRWGIVILALIGIGMCAFSGGNPTSSHIMIRIASILGAVSVLLILYGVVMGTKLSFILLSVMIFALWALSTLRHLIAAQ